MSQISFHKRAPSLASRLRPHWPSRHLNESPLECGVRTQHRGLCHHLPANGAIRSLLSPSSGHLFVCDCGSVLLVFFNMMDASSLPPHMVRAAKIQCAPLSRLMRVSGSLPSMHLLLMIAAWRRCLTPHPPDTGHCTGIWAGVHCHWSPAPGYLGPCHLAQLPDLATLATAAATICNYHCNKCLFRPNLNYFSFCVISCG